MREQVERSDGKSLRVKILKNWKEYLKKGGVQLNMGLIRGYA